MTGTAWAEIRQAVRTPPYPVTVLPVDQDGAEACLTVLEVTPRSWLGAVVANSGGLAIDHGWLRVLGSGYDELPSVSAATDRSGWLVVAFDVLGGQFAWLSDAPGVAPTIRYFGPDTLDWQDLEMGYGQWLSAMLTGSVTGFYDTLRWPGWEREVAAVPLDRGIFTFPPPWSREGKDVSTVSRQIVPLVELCDFHTDAGRQIHGAGPAT